jgi:hypothetical protein
MNLFGTLPSLFAICLIVASAAPAPASSPDAEARPERQLSGSADSESVEPSVIAGENIGVRVDSETGEATSSDSQPPAGALSFSLTKALSRSIEGLHVFELANGGQGIDLGGRYRHALVVRMRADGTFETVCVDHAREAEALLKRGSSRIDAKPEDR